MKKELFLLFVLLLTLYQSQAQQADLVCDISDKSYWYGVVGDTVEFDMILTNSGDADATEFNTEIFLSTNTTWDASDVSLDSFRTGSLRIDQVSEISDLQIIIPPGTAAGTYYIIAYADFDEDVSESNENNNQDYQEIEIITEAMLDFEVTNININPDPLNTSRANISYTVKNNSGSFLPRVPVRLYFSEDANYDDGDTYLETEYSYNESGSSDAVSINDILIQNCKPAGSYYIIAMVDQANDFWLEYAENNENNNITNYEFDISVPDTDLEIEVHEDAPSSENTYILGDNIPLIFSVNRVGDDELTSGNTKIYISEDDTYDAGDALITTITYDADDLDCGGVDYVYESFEVTNDVTDGIKYFIAIVEIDDGFVETDLTNNTAVFSVWISKSINLSLSNCTVSPTSFTGNQNFTINYDISNDGTATLGKVYAYLVVYQGSRKAGEYALASYSQMLSSFTTSETKTVSSSSLFDDHHIDILETNCTFRIELYVEEQKTGDDYDIQESCSNNVTVDVDIDYSIDNIITSSYESDVFISEEDKNILITIETNDSYNFDVFAYTNQDLSFYISTDNVLSGGDQEINVFNQVFVGSGYWLTLNMPFGFADGYYYLIAEIDSNNDIDELDENNNTFAKQIYLTYPVDTESEGNGDWFTIDWTNGTPDGDYFNAFISNSVTINDNVMLKSLTIEENGNLTVEGQNTSVKVFEDFLLKPNASLIGQSQINSLNTYFQTEISKYTSSSNGWHFISFPLFEWVDTHWNSEYVPVSGSDDFFEWNEPSGKWHNFYQDLNENVIAFPGDGFLVAYSTTITRTNHFSTQSFNDGQIKKNLSFTAGDLSGWNLIGNPYPSAIKWNDVVKSADVGSSFYIANPSNGTYLTSNGTTGDIPSGEIPIFQGFFVKANSAGQSVTFKESAQIHSDNDFYKSENKINTENTLKVNLLSSDSENSAYIRIRDDATLEYDQQYDAYKLFGFAVIPQVYTQINNTDYAINIFDLSDEVVSIPLGIYLNAEEDLSFQFTGLEGFDANTRIELEDKTSNKIINLREQSSYNFRGTTSDEAERFVLHFSQVTGLHDIAAQDAQVYAFDGRVYIRLEEGADYSQMHLFDLSGRLLHEQALSKQSLQSFDFNDLKGVYLVQLQGESGSITEKVTL